MVSVKLLDLVGTTATFRCGSCGNLLGRYRVLPDKAGVRLWLSGDRPRSRIAAYLPREKGQRLRGPLTQSRGLERDVENYRLIWTCPEGHPRIRREDRLAQLEGYDKKPFPEFYV